MLGDYKRGSAGRPLKGATALVAGVVAV